MNIKKKNKRKREKNTRTHKTISLNFNGFKTLDKLY